jgi:hypothetical protein
MRWVLLIRLGSADSGEKFRVIGRVGGGILSGPNAASVQCRPAGNSFRVRSLAARRAGRPPSFQQSKSKPRDSWIGGVRAGAAERPGSVSINRRSCGPSGKERARDRGFRCKRGGWHHGSGESAFCSGPGRCPIAPGPGEVPVWSRPFSRNIGCPFPRQTRNLRSGRPGRNRADSSGLPAR